MSNRFRAYDKISKETLKMEDDYTFRSNDGRLILNVRGDRKMANGVVVRRESGTWVVRAENGLEYLMDDVFCDVKERGGK